MCVSSSSTRLSLKLSRSVSFSTISSLLYVISPAPAIFSVLYTEPFYAFFTFSGMLYAVNGPKSHIQATACFAVAASFRANGLLNIGFLAWGLIWQMPTFIFMRVSVAACGVSQMLTALAYSALQKMCSLHYPIELYSTAFHRTSGLCIFIFLHDGSRHGPAVVQRLASISVQLRTKVLLVSTLLPISRTKSCQLSGRSLQERRLPQILDSTTDTKLPASSSRFSGFFRRKPLVLYAHVACMGNPESTFL